MSKNYLLKHDKNHKNKLNNHKISENNNIGLRLNTKLKDMTEGERSFVKLLQDNDIYYFKPRRLNRTYHVGKPFHNIFVFDPDYNYVEVHVMGKCGDSDLKLGIKEGKLQFRLFFETAFDIARKCERFGFITQAGLSKLKVDRKPLSPIVPHEKYSNTVRKGLPVKMPLKQVVHTKVWY